MKKLFIVLSLTAIGHCALARPVILSSGIETNSEVTNTVNTDDQNYTVEVVVNGNDVYMTVTGTDFNPEFYYITDMQSNVVQQGVPEVNGNTMHVVFSSNLPSGTYLITGKTRNNSFTNTAQH